MTCSIGQIALDAYIELLQAPTIPLLSPEEPIHSRLQRRLRFRYGSPPAPATRPVARQAQRVRFTGA